MPYVKMQTNVEVDTAARKGLLARISSTTAEALGKPERYVMVALEPPTPMLFAGTEAPTAYLELKSIGLAESTAAQLSATLCAIVEEAVGIRKDRIYIEFADAPRKMWGWDGTTF